MSRGGVRSEVHGPSHVTGYGEVNTKYSPVISTSKSVNVLYKDIRYEKHMGTIRIPCL